MFKKLKQIERKWIIAGNGWTKNEEIPRKAGTNSGWLVARNASMYLRSASMMASSDIAMFVHRKRWVRVVHRAATWKIVRNREARQIRLCSVPTPYIAASWLVHKQRAILAIRARDARVNVRWIQPMWERERERRGKETGGLDQRCGLSYKGKRGTVPGFIN